MMSYAVFITDKLILIILLISSVILLSNWKRLSPAIGFFSYYILFNLFIELTARIFRWNGVNNLPLLHLYTLGEFILFSIFFYKILKINPQLKSLFKVFIVFIASLIILNSIFLQPISGFNGYAKTPVQCIIIIYSLLYFFTTNYDKAKKDIVEKIRLMINTAILIYYSGSIFIFMFSDYFYRQGIALPNGFWLFNTFLNLLFQIIILSSICMVLKNKKSMSLSS